MRMMDMRFGLNEQTHQYPNISFMPNTSQHICFVICDAPRKEYFGEMPWLALDFSDRKLKEQLSTAFKVQGIPSLATELQVCGLRSASVVDYFVLGLHNPYCI